MFRTMFLLGFLLIFTKGFGHIEDHLKVIGERSDVHRMKNIDFIYMINLDERPEKWQFCLFYVMRFSPITIRYGSL